MGRTSRRTRPPASGAIIFYGRSKTTSNSVAAIPPTQSTAFPNIPSNSSTGDLNSDRSHDEKSLLSLQGSSSEGSTSIVHSSFYTSQSFEKRGIATGHAILRLMKDISDAFAEVPYVKVVVSLVQQILTIYDEIQGNKDRSKELVGKVMIYARVVFEALLAINGQKSKDLSAIKEDLIQIASVLQSIYETLQHGTTSQSMSRLHRLLYRDDIASKLAEQDRKLDTTITAFQLKSSIVLRSGIEKIDETKGSNILEAKTSTRSRRFKSLRAKPQIMFGRSKETNAVVNAFLQYQEMEDADEDHFPPRICILGSGGIGKTTLALSILHHELICEKYNVERFFISCEAATSPDLFLGEIAASLDISAEDVMGDIFDAVLSRLQSKSCLLIVDNFETPWDPPQNRSEIEFLLTEITSLRTVNLILTMRGSQQPAGTRWSQILPPLQPIDIDSAVSIFQAIAHKSDQHATDLIKAVDCVPLAVTLFANLAAVDGETTQALWSRWEEESTSMVENGGQDRLNSLETSIQLSLSSPRMQRDPGALQFLSAMSLLPDGMSPDTLRVCEAGFPGITSVKKAISTLRQNALVYEDASKDLRILSPIRLFVHARHPPSSKSMDFFYDHFTKLALQGTSYHDPTIRSRLQREANNTNAILMSALASSTQQNLPELVQATLCLCHYTYVSGKGSTQAIARAVEKLEALNISTIPIVHPVPSYTRNKSNWHKAFGKIVAKSKLVKTPPVSAATQKPSDIDVTLKLRADCLGCWGQLLSRQSQFDLAGEKFELAKELHIKAGDLAGEAYDLLNIGLLLSRDPATVADALEVFQTGLILRDKLNDKTGKAYDLLGAGHAYRDLGRFPEAEDTFNTAINLFAEVDDDSGQASALNGLATVMLTLSRCSEAAEHFMEAIKLNIGIGDVIGEAENVAGLAVTFLLRSRFLEAQKTIEKAMALRQPIIDPDHLHILGRVCMARDNYNQAKIYISRSLSCHENIGDSRGQADDLLYLGFIELHQGNPAQARALADQALVKAQYNDLMVAETRVLKAQVLNLYIRFSDASWYLRRAFEAFEADGCTLGKARCLYVHAIQHLRRSKFDKAMEKLNQALDFHIEVGNIQGQADDLNKICETLMLQGAIDEPMTLISEALAFHIQIDDKSGQGDDLYIQASLFLAQNRYADAEHTIRKALELHVASESAYGIARDNASLSNIIWQQQQQEQQDTDQCDVQTENPFVYLKTALELFRKMNAVGEFHECREQKRRMRGKEPRDPKTVRVPDWNTTSDEEDYNNEYGYYADYTDDDCDYDE